MCKLVHEYGVISETQPKEAMKWSDSKMKLRLSSLNSFKLKVNEVKLQNKGKRLKLKSLAAVQKTGFIRHTELMTPSGVASGSFPSKPNSNDP